jgi:UDP-glucose 4-epimerase
VNVLLTGGSGFIGKNIKEYFSKKYQLLVPSRSELNLLDDNMVRKYFEKNDIDVVIHSAAKPGHRNANDLSGLFYSNIRMYYNLAQQSKNYGKMIVLGSGAIYDTRNDIHKVSEDSYKDHLPVDEHGFCKYVCARDIEQMDNILELRLFGIFGKYEDYAIRFISNAIAKTLLDLPITIKQNRKFDYLYIDDLMPVLNYFINNDAKYTAYNVTPDKEIELYQLAEIVRGISGKDLPIMVSEPGLGKEYSGDNSLLRNELREVIFTPIHLAIEKLYAWYKDHVDLISKDLLLFDK